MRLLLSPVETKPDLLAIALDARFPHAISDVPRHALEFGRAARLLASVLIILAVGCFAKIAEAVI